VLYVGSEEVALLLCGWEFGVVHDVRGDRVVIVAHPLALGQKSETINYF